MLQFSFPSQKQKTKEFCNFICMCPRGSAPPTMLAFFYLWIWIPYPYVSAIHYGCINVTHTIESPTAVWMLSVCLWFAPVILEARKVNHKTELWKLQSLTYQHVLIRYLFLCLALTVWLSLGHFDNSTDLQYSLPNKLNVSFYPPYVLRVALVLIPFSKYVVLVL